MTGAGDHFRPRPYLRTSERVYFPYNTPRCYACAAELRPVDGGGPPSVQPWQTTGQYHDALDLRVVGGYGMFFDSQEDPVRVAFLCGDCAAKACEALPWLAELMS